MDYNAKPAAEQGPSALMRADRAHAIGGVARSDAPRERMTIAALLDRQEHVLGTLFEEVYGLESQLGVVLSGKNGPGSIDKACATADSPQIVDRLERHQSGLIAAVEFLRLIRARIEL